MITCSCVGHFGYWGNSLFQYAAARTAAEVVGTELRIPADWAGRRVFSTVSEGPIDVKLPDVSENDWSGEDNVNLVGYFQSEQWVSRLSHSKLRQWLVPREAVEGPDVAIHKRRGDYVGNGYYAVVTDASYERAVIRLGLSGTIRTYGDFVGQPLPLIGEDESQFRDFLEIAAARTILRANSTYSWWAATLSNARVYSPVVGDLTGWQDVEFVEGNHPKLVSMFSDLHIQP